MNFSKYALLGGSIFLLSVGSMSSCTQNAGQQNVDPVQQQYLKKLPSLAVSTLNKIKGDIDTLMFVENDEIDVRLKNGVEIYFDQEGEWNKVSMHKNEMTDDLMKLLPVQTQTYLNENASGKTIKRFDRSRKKRLTIAFAGKEELNFARNGKFLPNDVKKLPSQVTTLLNKYFADDAIKSATVDPNYEYSVDLQSGVYLEFDRMGRFERVETPKGQTIPANFVNYFPSMMMKYMDKNYSDKVIRRIIRKDYGYMVKTEKPDAIELCFSKTGDYLRLANKGEENED